LPISPIGQVIKYRSVDYLCQSNLMALRKPMMQI